MREETFKGVGGLSIFFRSWHPDIQARGVVVIAPGFNSHSGHYVWVGRDLAANGLVVYAIDHRGRGRSEGERFYVDSFADYAADLATLIATCRQRNPGLPIFLLGHSAGGVVACLYTLDHQEELAGLICESFAYQVPAPDFALAVLKGLSHIVPHAHVLKLKNEDFSRDPNVVGQMNEDPLIAGETQPTKTVAEMVRADERLTDGFPRITVPLLILHGTADRATKPAGSQLFHDTAGSKDKTLKLYEGHYHDLLNDIGKEAVLGDIKDWIFARVGARGE
jgi:acylglycerol lipase